MTIIIKSSIMECHCVRVVADKGEVVHVCQEIIGQRNVGKRSFPRAHKPTNAK